MGSIETSKLEGRLKHSSARVRRVATYVNCCDIRIRRESCFTEPDPYEIGTGGIVQLTRMVGVLAVATIAIAGTSCSKSKGEAPSETQVAGEVRSPDVPMTIA